MLDVTPIKIYADELPVTETVLLSVTQETLIHNIILHNTSASSADVSLGIQHGAESYTPFYNFSISPYDSVQFSYTGEGMILAVSDDITGLASATGVNILVYGSTTA